MFGPVIKLLIIVMLVSIWLGRKVKDIAKQLKGGFDWKKKKQSRL